MREAFYIFIIFLFTVKGFSQCKDIDKLELGGAYLSKTSNYIAFEKKYKDSVYYDSVADPTNIKKIGKYSDFILKKSKEYIVQRANINFFNELELYQIEVNYDDAVKIDLSNPDLFELSNYPNITYWVIYTYHNKGIKYAFGLEFDKSGNMVSKAKFPDSSLNPKFETLTAPCLALEKVKSDKRFKGKKVQFIKLSYLEEANSFC